MCVCVCVRACVCVSGRGGGGEGMESGWEVLVSPVIFITDTRNSIPICK